MVHARIYKRYGSGVPSKGMGITRYLGRLGPLTFLGLAVIVVVFSYIGSVNVYSLKYYKLEEAKLKLSKLKDKQDELLLQEAELRSSDRVGTGVEGLKMEKAENIIYIDSKNTVVARK